MTKVDMAFIPSPFFNSLKKILIRQTYLISVTCNKKLLPSTAFMKIILLLIALLASSPGYAECTAGDCQNGIGTFRFDGGGIYVGYFSNNYRNGKGTYTWASGDKYEGDYIKGSRTGKGTYTWGKGSGTFAGDKYVGDFIDRAMTGKGTYTCANGDKYVGGYQDGERHGKGTFTWANGSKYVGEWKDNKRHGKGVDTSYRTTKVGVWENDDYLGTEVEWEAEQTKRKLAEEKRIAAEEKARKKYQGIYNACLLDKGKGVDMSVGAMREAAKDTCEAIAEDPSWLEELKYD
jgi:hypothetical protein